MWALIISVWIISVYWKFFGEWLEAVEYIYDTGQYNRTQESCYQCCSRLNWNVGAISKYFSPFNFLGEATFL